MVLFLSLPLFSQNASDNNIRKFDRETTRQEALKKGVSPIDMELYLKHAEKVHYAKLKKKSSHSHNHIVPQKTIYLNESKPSTVGCGNMGFEEYNFINWSGTTGNVTDGTVIANYTPTGFSIVNPDGNNVFMDNFNNYHTILTIPPTNPIYPNCNQGGYDSIAVKNSGGQLISEIPFISPYSFDGASARLGGTSPGEAGELKYMVSTSPTVKRLSFSYALVLENGGSGHDSTTGPIFKVEVRNENTGQLLPGCTSYTFNPYQNKPTDSLRQSAVNTSAFYRKWTNYSVDLSGLPNNTNVSVTFLVTGCSLGGHYGYAYVDAECGGVGSAYVNKCSGSNIATLVAPTGFVNYQWLDPSNNPIPGATNDSLIVNPATVGQIYSVQLLSPGGCALTQTIQIVNTIVEIINLNSTNSCAGGTSGSALVQASGSNSSYSYTWTATSGPNIGQNVSFSQMANNLASGSYSVLVSSPGCGQSSANINVGISPPSFFSQSKSFCGTVTFLEKTGNSNYQWFLGSGSSATAIPSPQGTNDSLYINNATHGSIYTLVYNNPQGCEDSIRFTLLQESGGYAYINNINNVCPGNTNGSAVINLNTSAAPNYTYTVYNASNTVINSNIGPDQTYTITSLPQGNYSVLISDGLCLYNNTFTINTIETTFTASTTNSLLCFPSENALVNLQYNQSPPSVCGTDPNICSSATPIQLFNSGSFTANGATTYPTPYGNWYTKGRAQYLIRKADLNSAGIFGGKISSLAFNVTNLNTSEITYPDFSIKMGCTNKTALPNASLANQPFETGLMTVYQNPNQPVSLGWLTHNFSQSYLWDGNSNLIVEVCFDFPGTFNWSENVSVQLKQMPYIANMYHVEDTNPVCSGTQPADNSDGLPMTNGINMLPNMRFGYCSYAPAATEYTVSVSSNGTITNNYNNDSIVIAPTFTAPPVPVAPTIYTITVTNPVGGCVATKTIEVLYPSTQMSITATTSTNSICEGDQVTLSSSGALNYNWTLVQGTTVTPIANTSSTIVTPPLPGNNVYVVEGSSNCVNSVPDTKTITINVIPKATLAITGLLDHTKCLSSDYVFNATITSLTPGNSGEPYTYAWTTLPGNFPAPGINDAASYTTNATSTTTLVLTTNGNCSNAISDTVTISNYNDNLSFEIIDSAAVCSNMPFTLNTSTSNGYPDYTYSWYFYPQTNSIANTSYLNYTSPSQEGIYLFTATVTDSCGYSRTDEQYITVLPPCNVIIPNIITPNNDGANDYFKIGNIEYHSNTSVIIFDRWGKKVYDNKNYNNEWKAEGLPDGTYFYIIDVPEDKKYSGFITVFSH